MCSLDAELTLDLQELTLDPPRIDFGPQELTLDPQELTLDPQELTLDPKFDIDFNFEAFKISKCASLKADEYLFIQLHKSLLLFNIHDTNFALWTYRNRQIYMTPSHSK